MHGEGAGAVPTDAPHLVVRAVHTALDALDEPHPPLALSCTNRIPHGRGLGSSAAAVVAGLLAGRALVAGGADRLDDDACSLSPTRWRATRTTPPPACSAG